MLTAWLMHVNLLHLPASISGIFWAVFFLEPQIGSMEFGLFAFAASVLEKLVYCASCFAACKAPAPARFAYFDAGVAGCNAAFRKESARFRLGTWYGNWLLGYAIIGNLPVFSAFTWGTVITHGVSFHIGMLPTMFAMRLKHI